MKFSPGNQATKIFQSAKVHNRNLVSVMKLRVNVEKAG